MGFPCSSEVKASACNAGDLDSIPGLARSPGEGNGNPLQYSCLENPIEPGRLPSMGSQRVRHDWVTSLSLFLYIYISGLNGIFSPPSIHIRKLELIQYLPTFFPFSFHNMTNSLLLFVGCIISKFYFLSEHSISCTICCFQNIHRKQCDPERWKINKLGKSIILPVVLVLSLLSAGTLAMVDSFIYWLVKVVPWVVSSRSAKSHISVCLQVFLLLLHLGHSLLG